MTLKYKKIIEITDFGPCVTKIILQLPDKTGAEALSQDTFRVYVEKKVKKPGQIINLKKNLESEESAPQKGYRKVLAAYPSDEVGNKKQIGEFIALDLEVCPVDPLSSELAYIHPLNQYVQSDFRITQTIEIKASTSILTGLQYEILDASISEQTQDWTNKITSHPEIPLRYGFYKPTQTEGEKPLIIWLHGAGEGGDDPTLAYTGNKVVNLSSKEIQKIFGGAYVLAPQSPTMWMDDGSGQYTKNGVSKYTAALKYLIDEFLILNGNVDKKRIYLGGCSNGGFMTMRMLFDYPDFFAAAYPVCEAFFNEWITENDIVSIKDTPIWFTHTKNDPVVKPEVTVLPTYDRLLKAGAKNAHLSYYENVIDKSGRYKDENGKPYEYHGHFSWIYTLNNDCTLNYNEISVIENGNAVTLFEWLSMQTQ